MPSRAPKLKNKFGGYKRDNSRNQILVERIRGTEKYKNYMTGYLQENLYLCEAKLRVCTHEAKQVHHIEEAVKKPELIWEENNLLAVCRECHDIFSNLERSGVKGKTKAVNMGKMCKRKAKNCDL